MTLLLYKGLFFTLNIVIDKATNYPELDIVKPFSKLSRWKKDIVAIAWNYIIEILMTINTL